MQDDRQSTDWRDHAAYRDIDPELFFPIGNAGPALLQILTRAYHLDVLSANRLRVATDWFNDIIEHRQFTTQVTHAIEYSSGTGS